MNDIAHHHSGPNRDARPRRAEVREEPILAYHYTSFSTLRSIVAHPAIWMSNAFCMNDRSEIETGIAACLEFLEENEQSAERDRQLNELRELHEWATEEGVYIASLSEEPDLLSQWDRYAENATGVCIGIELGGIQCRATGTTKLTEAVRFVPTVYERTEQRKRVEKALGMSRRLKHDLSLSRVCMLAAVASLKSRYFSEEKEIRVLYIEALAAATATAPDAQLYDEQICVSPLRFRESKNRLIDYVELSLPKHVIREIVLGPHCQTTVGTVRKLLAHHGFDAKSVTVRRSGTPLSGRVS